MAVEYVGASTATRTHTVPQGEPKRRATRRRRRAMRRTEDLRGAIPGGDDAGRVGTDGVAVLAGQAEITERQAAVVINQDVGRLDVAMNDPGDRMGATKPVR